VLRPCGPEDFAAIHAIINDAAAIYRGRIPEDCWHEPYMPPEALQRDISEGVTFWGWEAAGALIGVMGYQRVADAFLIRHAYVLPAHQSKGIGHRLLTHFTAAPPPRLMVGTWRAASWAIAFYERHGFVRVPTE
jgi:GNAT superfamily N-acetyltransferase